MKSPNRLLKTFSGEVVEMLQTLDSSYFDLKLQTARTSILPEGMLHLGNLPTVYEVKLVRNCVPAVP
jgi:hypothetical protein